MALPGATRRNTARLASGPARPFVVVDRDGTLIVDKIYLADPEQIEFLPGVIDGLRALRTAGFGVVMVTNQSGVGRGYFSEATLQAVHERLIQRLADHGLSLDGLYYCPHAPDEGCDCRKPRPGLILRAAQEHGFDPSKSALIGDSAADMGAARASGMFGVQLCPGEAPTAPDASLSAPDFAAAAAAVLDRWRELGRTP